MTTVLAKKKDWPKLQEGTVSFSELLFVDEASAIGARVTPRLSASTIAFIRSSRDAAKNKKLMFYEYNMIIGSLKSIYNLFFQLKLSITYHLRICLLPKMPFSCQLNL